MLLRSSPILFTRMGMTTILRDSMMVVKNTQTGGLFIRRTLHEKSGDATNKTGGVVKSPQPRVLPPNIKPPQNIQAKPQASETNVGPTVRNNPPITKKPWTPSANETSLGGNRPVASSTTTSGPTPSPSLPPVARQFNRSSPSTWSSNTTPRWPRPNTPTRPNTMSGSGTQGPRPPTTAGATRSPVGARGRKPRIGKGGRPERRESRSTATVSRIVDVSRVGRMTSQGRRNQFRALVIAGNGRGAVSFGVGKGATGREAVKDARKDADVSYVTVEISPWGGLYHDVEGKFNNTKVLIRSCRPPSPDRLPRPLKAGRVVLAVADCVGLSTGTTKVIGRRTVYTVVHAVFNALSKHESPGMAAARRGMKVVNLALPRLQPKSTLIPVTDPVLAALLKNRGVPVVSS